jgi:hypothetical protein
MTDAIPPWNAHGAIPPIDATSPTSAIRSPYTVTMSRVVERFGTTATRCAILDGLLRYRAVLYDVGLVQGFQWLDGSFLEDIETIEGRPPNDVDVVTFFRVPEGLTQQTIAQRAPHLLDPATSKQQFRVDAYLESLDAASEGLVERVVYWYSVWSHRRSGD